MNIEIIKDGKKGRRKAGREREKNKYGGYARNYQGITT